MKDFIRSVRNDMGITIIIIEHDMRVVMDISDQISVLDYGRKLPKEIRKKYRRTQKSSKPIWDLVLRLYRKNIDGRKHNDAECI